MTIGKVERFTLYNDLGESVLADRLEEWIDRQVPFRLFHTIFYSWVVDGRQYRVEKEDYRVVLPDRAGFICFRREHIKDNCCLRNAYGEITKRLVVPWELTPYDLTGDEKMWFGGLSSHVDGKYGVRAAIETAGDWYFELDYHRGEFLWGKEIRF